MGHKSKFNKRKCRTCKYHGMESNKVICYYAGLKGRACLRRVGKEVVDTRGEDFNKCKLYERGKA